MEAIDNPTELQLARRKAARERKQRQRSKERARSDRAVQAYFEGLRAVKINAEDLARRDKNGMCTLGEISPGVNASTLDDALEVAREFARALSVSDVQDGESLYEFERRVFEAWIVFAGFNGSNNATVGGGGGPYLNRATGKLFPGFGHDYWLDHGGFDKCWSSLPDAREKIDTTSLTKLKALKKPEEPKPEPEPIPPPPTPIVPQQPDSVHFGWVPPQAHQFLASGRADVHM